MVILTQNVDSHYQSLLAQSFGDVTFSIASRVLDSHAELVTFPPPFLTKLSSFTGHTEAHRGRMTTAVEIESPG